MLKKKLFPFPVIISASLSFRQEAGINKRDELPPSASPSQIFSEYFLNKNVPGTSEL
jgi:hypothetical protein